MTYNIVKFGDCSIKVFSLTFLLEYFNLDTIIDWGAAWKEIHHHNKLLILIEQISNNTLPDTGLGFACYLNFQLGFSEPLQHIYVFTMIFNLPYSILFTQKI